MVNALRGDHEFTNKFDAWQEIENDHHLRRRGLQPSGQFVIDAERVAIKHRREHVAATNARDRTRSLVTGLALSGGGIRSGSFALGALQGIHATYGIEGIDYLSTVSGGGYVGCA